MLLNPFTANLPISEGTRALRQDVVEQTGLLGLQLTDPKEPWRIWTLQWLYAPIRHRRVGGVRAKFLDARGFFTFCNQRDLELLLGHAQPGDTCPWMRDEYPAPSSPDWYGFCADEEDLRDDLFERELSLRYAQPDPCIPLLPYTQIERLVHFDEGADVADLLLLQQDNDTTIENVLTRWMRVDRQRAPLL